MGQKKHDAAAPSDRKLALLDLYNAAVDRHVELTNMGHFSCVPKVTRRERQEGPRLAAQRSPTWHHHSLSSATTTWYHGNSSERDWGRFTDRREPLSSGRRRVSARAELAGRVLEILA